MRYVGIDVGSDRHVVAAVDEDGKTALKPAGFGEDAEGHGKLFGLLEAGPVALIALEATGHYWRNLFAALVGRGYAVALLNPLRTRRMITSVKVVGIGRWSGVSSVRRPLLKGEV